MVKATMALGKQLLIAPCGINCGVCKAHIRAKKPCPGCRAEDSSKPKTRVICKIKTCETLQAQGFAYCFECSEFPCEPAMHLDKRYRTKYGTSPIDNLLSIKLDGMARFLEGEESKWTCPECRSTLCMHEPACRACGYVWNKSARPTGMK